MVDTTDAFTPNLKLVQPAVGASDDTWGTKTNSNWTILDGLFGTGGTGSVIRTNDNGNAAVQGIDVATPTPLNRPINFLTAALLRWVVGVFGGAESGANAGSDFVIERHDDLGNAIAVSLGIKRSTGVVTFETTPEVGTNLIYHQGNLPAVIATVSEPVGTIKMFGGTGDPAGGNYLICDGRAISRTTYAALFAVTGIAYGAGDGSTTFNIPNFQERSPLGQTVTQSLIPQYDARVIGNKIGEGNHLTTVAEMPAHTHTITDPGHSHSVGAPSQFQFQAGGGGIQSGTTVRTSTDPTGITQTNSAGSGTAHNNVQPSLVVSFIIRVQ